ncbi:hypothetical protein MASR1M32_12330 [Rhodobacter sp.]
MHIPLKGEPAMRLHRMIRALYRFEDSPLGLALGAAALCVLSLLPLFLNEGGMR